MMACGGGKDEQGKWLAGLLGDGAKATQVGDGRLVLTADTVTIDLAPAQSSS